MSMTDMATPTRQPRPAGPTLVLVCVIIALAVLAALAALLLAPARSGTAPLSVPAGLLPGVQTAYAQEGHPPEAPGITVMGEGAAAVQPDVTTIRLGVQVTGTTPSEALTLARQGIDRVHRQLHDRGVAEADVQTSGLNVFPLEGPTKDGGQTPPPITGYRGDATIAVQVQDVNRVGLLMDAAMQAGATSTYGLLLGVKDDSQYRQQALADAINHARPKAQMAASVAGLSLGGIRAVVELPSGVPAGIGGAGGLGGGEGISPGTMNVTVRAQVTFDVSR
jgi:hypothetical protein